MVGTRDAANREREWQEHLKSWRYQLGLGSENLFRHEEHRVSGMSHGDEFVATGPTDRLADKRTKLQGEPNQNKSHQLWVNRKQRSAENIAPGKARSCVSARSQTQCRLQQRMT